MSLSQIIHALCGGPALDGCIEIEPARCWVCASEATCAMPQTKWNGSSFTGQNRVRCPSSEWVCLGCVFITSRISPVPGRPAKPGKKFGGNYRNYSHLWEQGWRAPACGDTSEQHANYTNASKGQKPLLREFLGRYHKGEWYAAIADSGQKHVVPWAPRNGPGRSGLVLFDEALVRIPPTLELVDEMANLLTAGATKDEIGRGDYTPRAWQLARVQLREFEARNASMRGGQWFALALWLAQRDEETVAARLAAEKAERSAKKDKSNARRKQKGTTADPNHGGAARPASQLPRDKRGKRAEELGPATGPDEGSGANKREPGGVGHLDLPRATAASAEQLGLPGFD